jgi:hypothetical protein
MVKKGYVEKVETVKVYLITGFITQENLIRSGWYSIAMLNIKVNR